VVTPGENDCESALGFATAGEPVAWLNPTALGGVTPARLFPLGTEFVHGIAADPGPANAAAKALSTLSES
jgi:hypothetical protein